MIWKTIEGKDLRSFIFSFNTRMKRIVYNLSEQNLNLSKLEIDSNTTTPDVKVGKVIIYQDSTGQFKYKNPDGTTGTFTTTPDP